MPSLLKGTAATCLWSSLGRRITKVHISWSVFNYSYSSNFKMKWGGKKKKTKGPFFLKVMRPVLKLRKTWVVEKVCQIWSTHSAEANSESGGDGASWPSHIPISPSFIHHCAVRIPPPPLFSQSVEQTKEHMAVSFSLSSYYFFPEDRSPKIHAIVHALPPLALRQLEGPSFPPGAMALLGWGQVNKYTQPHSPFLKFWKEREKHKPGSAQEVMSTVATGRCWLQGGGQSQTEINDNKWLANSLGMRICRALQLSCSHESWAALKGGHPSDPQLCPQAGKRQWHSSCHQQRWEKHGFGVQIIVPHIPLFAIVISAVVLLDKQTSEKMQWAVRIDLHRADNWTFNLFTSPNRYLGWHLLINGIIRCLICSSQKLITQPMVKP